MERLATKITPGSSPKSSRIHEARTLSRLVWGSSIAAGGT